MKQDIYSSIRAKLQNASLIIVSKYRSEQDILEYYEKGHRDFAENRVQEMVKKYESLPKDIHWHMIGHLQSNKVKYIVPFITMIHSVHAFSLIDEIEKQAEKYQRMIPICIQFNLAKEPTKSGFMYEEWQEVMQYATQKRYLQVKGIMVMGPHSANIAEIDTVFQQAETLFHEIKQLYPQISEISMGMSNDYELALQHGATMIRVGSILFS